MFNYIRVLFFECFEFADQMRLPDLPDKGIFALDLFYWDEFEVSVGMSREPEMGSYRELCFCLADVGHSPNVTSTTPLSGFARLPHVLGVVLDALTIRFSAGDQVYYILICASDPGLYREFRMYSARWGI